MEEFLRLVLALIFVLSLMGMLALVLKRLGFSGNTGTNKGPRRLKIVEALPLDTRRRAVIVKCDEKEHLVILGPNSETLIERDINAKKGQKTQDKKPHEKKPAKNKS